MALVIKNKVTRNEAGTELYIEFEVATGVYNVSTNPGGFGTPNPSRNTLAVIFYGNIKKSAGDILITPNVYDPLTVASFTIALTRELNGHLSYGVFFLPIFNNSITYVENDIVFDNTNPVVPFIKKFVANEWVTITAADLVDTAVIQKATNYFPIPDAERFRNELNAERVQKLKAYIDELCGCDEYNKIRNNFDFVDGLLEEAINDFCAGAYAEAQVKLENIFAFETVLNG